MNDRQEAKLDSYTTLETVLDAHPAPLDTLPAGQVAVTTFRDLLADLREVVENQAGYTPLGPLKRARLRALARVAVPIAQAVMSWAHSQDDLPLAQLMDVHDSDFTRAADQDARALGALVHTHATDHALDLEPYGITPARLADLDAAVTAFAQVIGQPRHAIAERKAHTEALAALFAEIDDHLENHLDPLALQFQDTPFYSEYRTARNIVGP